MNGVQPPTHSLLESHRENHNDGESRQTSIICQQTCSGMLVLIAACSGLHDCADYSHLHPPRNSADSRSSADAHMNALQTHRQSVSCLWHTTGGNRKLHCLLILRRLYT